MSVIFVEVEERIKFGQFYLSFLDWCWVQNGQYNWICNTVEYPDNLWYGDVQLVQNTYLVTSFWNNFENNSNKSPVNGETVSTAVGWREQDKAKDEK